MEALGDDERAAGGIRFGRDDKVSEPLASLVTQECRTSLQLARRAARTIQAQGVLGYLLEPPL